MNRPLRPSLALRITAACCSLLVASIAESQSAVYEPIADFLARHPVGDNDRMQRVVMDVDGDGHPEIFLTLSSLQPASGTSRWSVYLPASTRPEKDGYFRLPAQPEFDPRLSFVGLLDPIVVGGQGWIVGRHISQDQLDLVSPTINRKTLTYSETPLGSLMLSNAEHAPLFKRFFGVTAPATIEDFTLAEWAERGDEYSAKVKPSTVEAPVAEFQRPVPQVAQQTAPRALPGTVTAEPFARDLWIAGIFSGLALLAALGVVFIPPRRRT